MSEHRSVRKSLGGFVPRGKRALIGTALIAVSAFVLGGLMAGGEHGPSETGGVGHEQTENAVPAPVIWTCSMHPQIRLPKAGKCPICYMDLIPLKTGTGDDVGPRQLRLSETAKQLARIQTTPAVRAFAEAEIRMVGSITYDETRLAYITAWVPGRLDRLFADYTGILVRKGDHLVRMYSPELLAAQEELIQAQAAAIALENAKSPALRSTARATVAAAREKLRLWGLTAAQIEHVEKTRVASEQLTIYAPIGGVVVHKDATEGMYVETGSRIYTIADLDRLWVIFEAYESDLPWLRYGQRVEFTSLSFPGDRFEGIISFIDPLVDPRTRTVRVRAIVENRDKRLKPDMFIRGVATSRIDGDGNIVDEYMADKWISPMHPEVVKSGPGQCDVCGMDLVPASSLGFVGTELTEKDAPLLIPASAPLITGKRAVVYVSLENDEGPLFEGREVELGPRAGDFYVVKSGVAEGERVVTNGAFKLDSELQIQARPSMMSPEGGGTASGHRHGASAPASAGASGEETTAADRIEQSARAREVLDPVYRRYFEVQMALANDDLEGARKAGADLSVAVGKVDMSVFSRSGHSHWMESSKKLGQQAARISSAKDIATARDGFFFLSEAAIDIHKSFGHSGTSDFYLTRCPMARGGNGAYWLQTEDIVWNSFYGASMLRCGSIDEKLPPATEGKR